MSRRSRPSWLALASFIAVIASLPAVANSHVRIVRLSSVEGHVQMDRGVGGGLERAILNAPIVEGTRLLTGSDGLAEVEFENESALRLTEDSEVRFSQLLLTDTGAKVNQFEVTQGMVYLDTASKGDDVYRFKVGEVSVAAHRDALVRLTATPDQLKVAVLRGEVQLEGGAQPVSVHKKETLTLTFKDPSKYEVVRSVEAERFDAWNKEREDYTRTYAENEGHGGPARAYGLQDLNYYGDFFYANGFGYVWQPYGFAGSMLNWSPYSNGAWLFDPGLGYAWASAYPWGWLPFHYGSWAFINGTGWAWLPGGGYNGQWYAGNFLTVPKVTRAPAGWTAATPPAILTTASTPPTVRVGAVGTSLAIPGGRITPNFSSLVPGHSVAAPGSTRPAASANAGHAVFASRSAAVSTGNQGHVFAAPARSVFLTAPEMGGMRGGLSGPALSAHNGGESSAPHSASGSGTSAHK